MFLGIILLVAAFINRLDTIYPDIPEKTAIQLLRQVTVYEKVILENSNGEALKGKAKKAGKWSANGEAW